MFYSHALLSRKGPLGTVWWASHLNNRLKKSDYTATHIPSAVEIIMWPEVPIALRLSSHLLLGVVRIYSKQVDYLYKDSYTVLTGIRKALSSVNINLTEDATQAPFYSITLPEKFELDAFEGDNLLDSYDDTHLKLTQEITLEDQVPTGTDPYIVVRLDQETRSSSPVLTHTPVPDVQPTQEDFPPPIPENSPGNTAEFSVEPTEDSTTKVPPPIETMRDGVHDNFVLSPPWSDRDDRMEPDPHLVDRINNDFTRSPASAETLPPEDSYNPEQQFKESQSVALQKSHEPLDLRIGIEHPTPELVVQPSPPVEQQRVKQRKRRRLIYDKSTVLTNVFMKAALEDPSDLVRRKRNCPSSNLDIWKLNKRLKKDSVFLEPLITGLSSDLRSLHKKEAYSSKPYLRKPEETHPETEDMQSPNHRSIYEMGLESLEDPSDILRKKRNCPGSNLDIWRLNKRLKKDSMFLEPLMTGLSSDLHSLHEKEVISSNPHPREPEETRSEIEDTPTRRSLNEVEIEHLRCDNFTGGNTDFEPSSSILVSPSRRGNMATPPPMKVGPDHLVTPRGPSISATTSPIAVGETQRVENSTLSDIPEIDYSVEDLSFLEQDGNTPAGPRGTPDSNRLSGKHMGTPEYDQLSARTRAVAQYLKRQSSITLNSGDLRTLSLNLILEGKSRKVSARMFHEVLVLTSNGLIDVNQEAPFGEITLHVTSKLSMTQPSR